MKRCLDLIYLFLHLPAATVFYKKCLITHSKFFYNQIENFKDGILNMPNSEVFDVEDTYLVALAPAIEEKVTRRGKTDSFTYIHSRTYKGTNNEIIEKKQQISARESLRLLESTDKSKKVLKKHRQCFLYNKSYLVIDNFINVDGCPSILRVLQEKDSKDVILPATLEVIRVLTDEKEYFSHNMADPNWKMPEDDKRRIELSEKKLSEN